MRSIIVVCLAAVFAGNVFAQGNEKYVSPTQKGVGVYKNQTRDLYEEPIAEVGTDDRLLVLETTRRHYKVQAPDGTEGWIEKRMVVATGKSKTFIFDNAEVIGYLDNPTPVYIIDADDPDSDPINLDRSFKEALRENVDRETVERQAE